MADSEAHYACLSSRETEDGVQGGWTGLKTHGGGLYELVSRRTQHPEQQKSWPELLPSHELLIRGKHCHL